MATIESVDHNQDNFEVTKPIVIQMILPNKKKSQKSDRASGSPKVRDQIVGIQHSTGKSRGSSTTSHAQASLHIKGSQNQNKKNYERRSSGQPMQSEDVNGSNHGMKKSLLQSL